MLSGILTSAISGANLNAQRLGASADNIANVSTPAYKATQVNAKTLTTPQTSTTSYAPGGVLGTPQQLTAVQGLLASTSNPTDLAISGNGFFPVSTSASGSDVVYTRDGSFAPDANGNLQNQSGHYLLATRPGSDALAPVNVARIGGTAQATSQVDINANLPATPPPGESYAVNARVTDSLGNPVNVEVSFQAQAGGSYDVTIASVTELSNGTTTTPPYAHTVTFGGNGLPTSGAAPGLNITGLASGAADLNIALDLGGLTKYGSDFVLGSVSSNGAAFGTASSVSVGQNGAIVASFDNGTTAEVGRVPVATFTNPQGLEALSGNVFRETDASGAATLRDAGSGGAGAIQGGAIEMSNTDLGREFVNMILAQSAYSASLKVLGVGDDMARQLMDIRA